MLQDNQYVELLFNFLLIDFTDCFNNCRASKLWLLASNVQLNLYNLKKIEEFSVSGGSLDLLIIIPGQVLPTTLRKLGLSDLRNLTLQHL